jgi:hypothetical protein
MSSVRMPDGREIGTGLRVRCTADFFQPKPMGTYSIAGAQPKMVGSMIRFDVTGEIRHVRGDSETAPTWIDIHIFPDVATEGTTPFECDKCRVREVVIPFSNHVKVEILGSAGDEITCDYCTGKVKLVKPMTGPVRPDFHKGPCGEGCVGGFVAPVRDAMIRTAATSTTAHTGMDCITCLKRSG